jgi:uncharacterized membrane protein
VARYQLVTEWHVDAPADRVWDALLRVREWPTWWKGFRSVDVLEDGEESGVGMQVRQRWRSLLPYTLMLELEILRVEQRRLLEGRSSGDMEGTCTWTFRERDGRTHVRFVMDVRPTKWWMNLPVPFAGRIVAANYGAIMRWGSSGFARRLSVGVTERAAQPELAGA